MDPQPLSRVINAPIISSFLSSDPSHLSILDTLLESRITGVDSEIRTECENGTVTRFPVLILCLDGLERLLENNRTAKELLEEKIRAEGGQPGIYGRREQGLAVARTRILTTRGGDDDVEELKKRLEAEHAEEKKKLKGQLEAEYATSNAKLREEIKIDAREKLAKREQELQAEAAKELAKLKSEVLTDATKDVAKQSAVFAEEFARCEKLREENAAEQLAKEKGKLEKAAAQELTKEKKKLEKRAAKELAKLEQDLKSKAADDIDDWKKKMLVMNEEEMWKLKKKLREDGREEQEKLLQKQRSENAENDDKMKEKLENLEKLSRQLQLWSDKFNNQKDQLQQNILAFTKKTSLQYDDITMSRLTAVKVLAKHEPIFETYKELCVQALAKYKRDLKGQYQAHLNDIELECRDWLRTHAGQGLRIEVLDGLGKTMERAKTFDGRIPLIKENVGVRITQEVLDHEAAKIMGEFKELEGKNIFDGGLRAPPLDAQAKNVERKVQEVQEGDIRTNVSISAGPNALPGNAIDRNIPVTSLKEPQEKQNIVLAPKDTYRGFAEIQKQSEDMKSAISKPGIGKALGELSSSPEAPGGAELRERQANIGQALHSKNVSSGVSETGPPKLQQASSWYAAKENAPMHTTNANQVINRACEGAVQVRMDPNAPDSRSAVKDTVIKLTIAEMRRANQANAIKSNVPSTIQLGKETETREAPGEFSFANTRSDGSTTRVEVEGLTTPGPSKEAAPGPTMERLQHTDEVNENTKLGKIESKDEQIMQLEHLASRGFASKQELFETRYSGKTVTEIYGILQRGNGAKSGNGAKRKRRSDSNGSEGMRSRKKTDQRPTILLE
jgi:hypothetical protein